MWVKSNKILYGVNTLMLGDLHLFLDFKKKHVPRKRVDIEFFLELLYLKTKFLKIKLSIIDNWQM